MTAAPETPSRRGRPADWPVDEAIRLYREGDGTEGGKPWSYERIAKELAGGISRQAARERMLAAAGGDLRRPRGTLLPWRVAPEHDQYYIADCLRTRERKARGQKLSDVERGSLLRFLAEMRRMEQDVGRDICVRYYRDQAEAFIIGPHLSVHNLCVKGPWRLTNDS